MSPTWFARKIDREESRWAVGAPEQQGPEHILERITD